MEMRLKEVVSPGIQCVNSVEAHFMEIMSSIRTCQRNIIHAIFVKGIDPFEVEQYMLMSVKDKLTLHDYLVLLNAGSTLDNLSTIKIMMI